MTLTINRTVAGNGLYQEQPIAVGVMQHDIGHLPVSFNFYTEFAE
jgi:hypothetical protein